MKQQYWSWQAGRAYFNVSVAGTAADTIEAESRRALAEAFALIKAAGLEPKHLVRSRLWARDSGARQVASDVRREVLSAELRAASASFIAPEHLCSGANMAIELSLLDVQNSNAEKTVREYEPPIVPPMFVSLDGMVFLSGDTNKEPGLETQLANISRDIERFLAIAGTNWGNATEISVFLARSVAGRAGCEAVLASLPNVDCRRSITLVDGFSAPEKRVEVEVTARLV